MVFRIFSLMLRIFVSLLILILGLILNMRSNKDREKRSPFECGFDPKNSARIPFSTRFFLLAVIFLVFDIEIVLLIPLPVIMYGNILYEVILGGGFFLIILILGLFHEW